MYHPWKDGNFGCGFLLPRQTQEGAGSWGFSASNGPTDWGMKLFIPEEGKYIIASTTVGQALVIRCKGLD